MRRSLILTPLATLLFASCEPGKENAAAEDGASGGAEARWNPTIAIGGTNHERLAAQDSVGRPPLPRNLLGDLGDICPVHHEKMKVREIPIVFEEAVAWKIESAAQPVTAEFPFGAEKIVSSGNALLPGEPLSARVYQCASCIAARRAAEKKLGATETAIPVVASE